MADAADGHRVQLLSVPESDGTLQFDALIRQTDGTTISIGVVRPDTSPWPLRGASRLRDRDLVDVNGVTVTVEQAITAIDFAFDEPRLLQHIVDGVLLAAAIDAEQADEGELADGALDEAIIAFRRGKGLNSGSDFRAWMNERSLTEGGLVELVRDQVRIAAFRRRLESATMSDSSNVDVLAAWLAERRATARVTWCWGNAARTRRVGES